MAIFHSYLSLPEGIPQTGLQNSNIVIKWVCVCENMGVYSHITISIVNILMNQRI